MNMRNLISRTMLAGLLAANVALAADEKAAPERQSAYTVAVYYWPGFHRDPFTQSKSGEGGDWTEWDIMRTAKPKFEGHYQPKEPLRGYYDESDPKEMAKSIDEMADAGIGVVIFDWYRYDYPTDDKLIEAALEKGFLGAPNRNRIRFALMWANHDYGKMCHNIKNRGVWRKGAVSRAAFDRHTDDAIKRYFSQPNYWKIDGKPYFSIYQLHTLMQGLGGLEATQAALKHFRERVKAAGFPDLHLNIVDWRLHTSLEQVQGQAFPGNPERKIATVADLLAALEVDSSTMYTWAHFGVSSDYPKWGEGAMRNVASRPRATGVTYFPHVTVGWDGTPRNYAGQLVTNPTPEQFGKFLDQTRAWLDQHPESKGIMTINSWNEWPEGSYVEPDKKHGTAYLDEIRRVFGNSDEMHSK